MLKANGSASSVTINPDVLQEPISINTETASSDIALQPITSSHSGGDIVENNSNSAPGTSHTAAIASQIEPVVERLTTTKMVLIATSVSLTYFLGSATITSVLLTLPDIAKDLGSSALEIQWVASAYGLAYGCGLLFAGRLADIYGRKFLFLLGNTIYIIFSIISANLRVRVALCIIRAMAGLGLAIASPAGFGIIAVNFRKDPARTMAFSVLGLGNPVGAAVGMIFGGLLAGVGPHGWQYLYYLLGGIAVFPVAVGVLVIPNTPSEEGADRRIDWLGAALISLAISLFTFSITQSGIATLGWKTPYVPALLVTSGVLLVAFGFWEHRLEHRTTLPPIVKLSILTRHSWKITVVLLCTFSVFMAVSGFIYLQVIFYQTYKGISALQNAIRILPAAIMGMAVSGGVMVLVPKVKATYTLIAGGLLTGIACLLFAICPPGTPYWACEFIAFLCLPCGAELIVCVGSILISNLCKDEEQSVAGAMFQVSNQLGASLGIVLSSLVWTSQEKTAGLLSGLKDAFGMNTAWSWIVPVLVVVALRRVGLAKDVANVVR